MKKILVKWGLNILILVGVLWFVNDFLNSPVDDEGDEVEVVNDGCIIPMPILDNSKNKDRGKVIKIGIPKYSMTAESKNKTEYFEMPYSKDLHDRLVVCRNSYCFKLMQENLTSLQRDSLINACGDCLLDHFPSKEVRKVSEGQKEEPEEEPMLEWNLMTSEYVTLKGLDNSGFKQLEFIVDIPVHYDWYYINAFQYKNGVPYKYNFEGNNHGINYINEEHFDISEVGGCPDLFLFGGVEGERVDTLLFIKGWCKPFVINDKKFQIHNTFNEQFGSIDFDINSNLMLVN